jgi:hypothetical protein
MDKFSSKIARISGMTNKEITDLHLAMRRSRSEYKLRANPKNLQNAISLREMRRHIRNRHRGHEEKAPRRM